MNVVTTRDWDWCSAPLVMGLFQILPNSGKIQKDPNFVISNRVLSIIYIFFKVHDTLIFEFCAKNKVLKKEKLSKKNSIWQKNLVKSLVYGIKLNKS